MATEKRKQYLTPPWQPDAIPTKIGWAHPTTGEQLVSRKNLPSPVANYIPNSKHAFDGNPPSGG